MFALGLSQKCLTSVVLPETAVSRVSHMGLSRRCCSCGRWVCWVTLIVALAGCDREDIRVYQAPKDARPQEASFEPVATRPRMNWTVPDTWQRVSGDRPMRVATFEATGDVGRVEIAVSAFPDDAGGLVANVNRWRRQLNLDPIARQDLVRDLTPFPAGSLKGFTLDITGRAGETDGKKPKRVIGAILHDGVGMTWFVKAVSQPVTLEPLKSQIVGFAHSFRLEGPNGAHDSGPSATDVKGIAPWAVPDNWAQDPSPSSIVSVAFNIDNAQGKSRVTVTTLAGDGGGLLPNFNRWRRQLGLPPVDRPEDQPTTQINGPPGVSTVTVVDLLAPASDPATRQRFLVAVLPYQNNTWYIKLTGPDTAVEQEKQAFEQFVASICVSQVNR